MGNAKQEGHGRLACRTFAAAAKRRTQGPSNIVSSGYPACPCSAERHDTSFLFYFF